MQVDFFPFWFLLQHYFLYLLCFCPLLLYFPPYSFLLFIFHFTCGYLILNSNQAPKLSKVTCLLRMVPFQSLSCVWLHCMSTPFLWKLFSRFQTEHISHSPPHKLSHGCLYQAKPITMFSLQNFPKLQVQFFDHASHSLQVKSTQE